MPIDIGGQLDRGRLGYFLARAKQMELIDRSYQLAAQTFVALIPLVLVATAFITGGQQYIAQSLIERFGLVGFSAQVVSEMMRTETGKIYWGGVLLSLYSAFSLSKRASRAYNVIWLTPQLPLRSQWRGLVWILVQIVMIFLASGLRRLNQQHGLFISALAVIGILLAWAVGEYASQYLLTRGLVPRRRLLVAVGLVTVGRVGVSAWAAIYMTGALDRQAELFGALGVVFSMFTYFLVSSGVILLGTLIASVLTASPEEMEAQLNPAGADDGYRA